MGSTCHFCSERGDLRPYGPGGAPICFPCMKATPEREDAARGVYGALIHANAAISPSGAVIATEDGPEPFELPTNGDDR